MLHADQDGEKLQALLRLLTELIERVRVVEALSTVPQMYCLAVVEVVRRKMFMRHYREVSAKSHDDWYKEVSSVASLNLKPSGVFSAEHIIYIFISNLAVVLWLCHYDKEKTGRLCCLLLLDNSTYFSRLVLDFCGKWNGTWCSFMWDILFSRLMKDQYTTVWFGSWN